MIRFGIRAKIAATVCVLILLAMLLINFVSVVTLKKAMIETAVFQGRTALSALQASSAVGFYELSKEELWRICQAAGASALLMMGPGDRQNRIGWVEEADGDMLNGALEARDRASSSVQFLGETWGVFWMQPRYAMITAPVGNGKPSAGAAMLLPLEPIYLSLRATQEVILIYLLINGLLLTLIGYSRISAVFIRPLSRLLKRAETYQDDGSVLFGQERGDSEFQRLSRALNRMLERISEDRERLRTTIQSLEKSNQELKRAQGEIIQAEKLASVGRLSSGIAHEIGNPIGIVLGYMDLIQRPDTSDEERREYVMRAQTEINRIKDILRQLLDFSRPASGKPELISVHAILQEIVDVVRIQPLMADISIVTDLASYADCVLADPNQLRQVFLNLILNSADAISSGQAPLEGQLIVRSEKTQNLAGGNRAAKGWIKLLFIDNGAGIPERDLGNIFDPFFTTKAPGKGTGLGLSVCFMLIEKMGGRIFVASQENRGTTITIYLPLADEEIGSKGEVSQAVQGEDP